MYNVHDGRRTFLSGETDAKPKKTTHPRTHTSQDGYGLCTDGVARAALLHRQQTDTGVRTA